jgi:two-component system sensor histidine kinase FlrB
MLPRSHVVPINQPATQTLPNSGLLADAFSEFISASSQLEASYRDLQQEVAHLGFELAERNAALSRSLAENDRMGAALKQIIDSMPCGVLVSDSANGVVMINPEGRRLLEIETEQTPFLCDLSSISQIDFESLLAREADGPDHELCISTATGNRWVAVGHRKLACGLSGRQSGNRKAPFQSVWILRDITANKLAEQGREAARNSMALAEMSTILAHEIRNPLASMELFAGLIAEDPSQTSLWVSHLRAGIRMLSGTVNNVLSIHGGGTPVLSRLSLSAAVKSAVDFVQPIAEQAGVVLSFAGGEGSLAIQGNESVLRQIVLNLICNAIRHTPADGRIDVRLQQIFRFDESGEEISRVLVRITDTGCGISPDLIGRIFEAGFSASGDTPGLGLAVCRRLMHQHGGEISVSSSNNCGSTFQLEFPAL